MSVEPALYAIESNVRLTWQPRAVLGVVLVVCSCGTPPHGGFQSRVENLRMGRVQNMKRGRERRDR